MQVTQRFAPSYPKRGQRSSWAKQDAVELMMIAMLCRGHVLIEDVPGVGKTTLASRPGPSRWTAPSSAFSSRRTSPPATSPALPSPISKPANWNTVPGMVMSQIVLADEINRTSPKTQSSLLEVMEEGQVSVDGVTYAVPKPFIVLATQNPVDFVGTYPLPEAQLDRFFMRVSIGYPSADEETRHSGSLCVRQSADRRNLKPICTSGDILLPPAGGGGRVFRKGSPQLYRRNRRRLQKDERAAAGRFHPRGHFAFARGSGQRAAGRPGLSYRPRTCSAWRSRCSPIVWCLSPEARMRNMTAEKILAGVIGSVPVPVKTK